MSPSSGTFSYRVNRNKLRVAWRLEGHHLLRTNLTEHDPAELWTYYSSDRGAQPYLQRVGLEAAMPQHVRGRHGLGVALVGHGLSNLGRTATRFHRNNAYVDGSDWTATPGGGVISHRSDIWQSEPIISYSPVFSRACL